MATTIFNEAFIKLIAAKLGDSGVVTPVGATSNGTWDARNTINIYSGTMPADVDAFLADPTVADSNLLVQYTDWNPGYTCTVDGSNRVFAEFLPGQGLATTVNATGTGTAEWALMWYDSLNNGTPKANEPSAIICDVTEDTGTGVIQLSTTTLVTGNPVTFLSLGYDFSYI